MLCYKCGKELHEYYEQNGHNFCPDCIKQFWPKCSICGRPMNRWVESEDGKKYCSDECREKDLPRCCICGKPVSQWITDKNGRIFCGDACFSQTLPRCDACGKRMKQWAYTQTGIKFCDENCRSKIDKVMDWYERTDAAQHPFKSFQLAKANEIEQNDLLSTMIFLFQSSGVSNNHSKIMIDKICFANGTKVDFNYYVRKAYSINKASLDSAVRSFSQDKYFYAQIFLLLMFCDSSYDCLASISEIITMLGLTRFEVRFLVNRISEQFKL